MSAEHRLVNPEGLAPPTGFAHAVVAAPGRTVFLGGQTAHDSSMKLVGETVAEQFDAAIANVLTALRAAGGEPAHLVSLLIYTTDVAAYRESTEQIGASYRERFGRHYPAMALFGIAELFDPAASVELVATAVIPA